MTRSTVTKRHPAKVAQSTARNAVKTVATKAAAPKVVRTVPVSKELRHQAETILLGKYDFMASQRFTEVGIEKELFGFEHEPELPTTSWYQPTRDDVLESARTSAPQLMSTKEEQLMFLRFNYAKLKLVQLQEKVAATGLNRQLADESVQWHHRFEHFREYLCRTNLALVLAMAKRVRLSDVDFSEVVSEGNMALLRSIEKFNVERGFKFSTYACRAILKAFSRLSQKSSKYHTRFPVEFEPDMEKSDWIDRRRDQVQEECIDELKAIINNNLASLSNIEQTVIERRFNWQQKEESPLTLEEVGRIIGVTKERVRQIQNKALEKIKHVMEDSVLRTQTEEPVAEEAKPDRML